MFIPVFGYIVAYLSTRIRFLSMDIFKLIISTTGYAIETVGVVIIVLGIIRATRSAAVSLSTENRDVVSNRFRHDFAQSTLVGMDFLVAGDIIRTVIVSHSLSDIMTLALLVAIRTVLVFTLHLELEGRWPWQQPAKSSEPQDANSS